MALWILYNIVVHNYAPRVNIVLIGELKQSGRVNRLVTDAVTSLITGKRGQSATILDRGDDGKVIFVYLI